MQKILLSAIVASFFLAPAISDAGLFRNRCRSNNCCYNPCYTSCGYQTQTCCHTTTCCRTTTCCQPQCCQPQCCQPQCCQPQCCQPVCNSCCGNTYQAPVYASSWGCATPSYGHSSACCATPVCTSYGHSSCGTSSGCYTSCARPRVGLFNRRGRCCN